MTGADLIQILMQGENVDKEVRLVDVDSDSNADIEEVKAFGSTVDIYVNFPGLPVDRGCDCEPCEECVSV